MKQLQFQQTIQISFKEVHLNRYHHSSVNQGVIAMKRYRTLPRSQELKPHHHIQENTFAGDGPYPFARDAIVVF